MCRRTSNCVSLSVSLEEHVSHREVRHRSPIPASQNACKGLDKFVCASRIQLATRYRHSAVGSSMTRRLTGGENCADGFKSF
jgi:hypothetical protein